MNETVFDPEIEKIEQEIINFLVDSTLFFGKGDITTIILSYFITRKSLTQRELKKLTGLSTGTISQELKKLVQDQVLIEKRKQDTQEKNYTMESIEASFLSYYIKLLDSVPNWEEDLKKIKSSMEENKKDLKNLKGYENVYNWTNNFLNTLPLVSIFLNIMKEEKKLIL